MEGVADTPDYGVAAPLPKDDLMNLFEIDKPTREMVEDSDDLYELLDRGQGVYIIVYDGSQPSEIFFAGYSFD